MGFRLGLQVLCAAVLGVLMGLFLGPYCSSFAWIGNAYVMLLQMAILPYIPLSLIHGIGSLPPQMAKTLLRRGWYFIPLLWGLMLLVLYLLALPIPRPQPIVISRIPGAERGVISDFLSTLAPNNAFYDIANNILPALALLGLLMGISMMLLKKKEPLLPLMEKLLHLLETLLEWLARLSPIAVFVHLAVAFGTVDFHDLAKLESYVGLVILGTLFLTLWALPKLLEALGPFSYGELLREARSPCIIAFATGVPSVAFPFMLRAIRRLMHKHHLHHENLRSTSQTVIPLAYSFIQLGNFFLYLFILFMEFFLREALPLLERILLPIHIFLLSLGAPSKSINGISFLTEHLHFPKQTIEYYIDTTAITQNFQVLLSVAGMLCFTLLVLLSYYKSLQIRWKKLFANAFLGVGTLLAIVFTIKVTAHPVDRFHDLFMNLSVLDVIPNPVPYKVDGEEAKDPLPKRPSGSTIQRVLETKVLRVGFDIGNIPYCYLNNCQQLAGYDIACAFELAHDLDCALEFVPMNRNRVGEELSADLYDIGMSALLMDEKRLLTMDFSRPYAQQQTVLLIARNRLQEFRGYEAIRAMPSLRLEAGGEYKSVARRCFPDVQNLPEPIFSDLLQDKTDAIIWSKLPAFIWCLGHPDYVVLDLGDILGQFYFAYGIKQDAINWASFIDEWLDLRDQSGFLSRQRNYWQEGKLPIEETRWSIMHDVLHWVK